MLKFDQRTQQGKWKPNHSEKQIQIPSPWAFNIYLQSCG